MERRIGILFAIVILIGIPIVVKASEALEADDGIKSYGSIIYEDDNGSVKIYAEDIALLQEKLSSIPDEIFDPVLYSHTHVWEYVDITDQGHTRHCNICGSRYDVVNQHTEARSRTCTISFDGQEYQGYEKICECGYSWKEEVGHTVVYTPQNETYHKISCALDGTSYCSGLEAKDGSHGMTLQPVDKSHHQNVCGDCGYKGSIEECVFESKEGEEGAEESEEDAPDEIEIRRYCRCGNYVTESESAAANLDVTDLEKTDLEEETGEEMLTEAEGTEEEEGRSDLSILPKISVSGNDIEETTPKKTGNILEESIEERGEDKL